MLVRARAAFPYLILLNCREPFESGLGNNGEKREEGVQGAKKETRVATVAVDKISTSNRKNWLRINASVDRVAVALLNAEMKQIARYDIGTLESLSGSGCSEITR